MKSMRTPHRSIAILLSLGGQENSVQLQCRARLEQADRMTAAFDPDLLTVDLIGDHANVLSLEFPVVWPAQSYVSHVSSIVEQYFASADTQ
jgi:hypothetical protein